MHNYAALAIDRTNLFGNPFQIVGWGHGVADIFHYYRAAANTRFA